MRHDPNRCHECREGPLTPAGRTLIESRLLRHTTAGVNVPVRIDGQSLLPIRLNPSHLDGGVSGCLARRIPGTSPSSTACSPKRATAAQGISPPLRAPARPSAHPPVRALGSAGDPNDQHLRDLLANVVDHAQVAHPKPSQPCPHHERGAGRSRVRPKCEHRPIEPGYDIGREPGQFALCGGEDPDSIPRFTHARCRSARVSRPRGPQRNRRHRRRPRRARTRRSRPLRP